MSEPATNPETVADRLAAARVRVRPLGDGVLRVAGVYAAEHHYSVHQRATNREDDYVAWINLSVSHVGTRAECIAACDAHHAAAVLANLEVVPSEEVKP